jgi:hypothetical protein
MQKFFKKIVVWGLLTAVLLNLFAVAVLYLHRQSNFYKPSFATRQIQKHFDHLVLGSSTGLTTIDTKLIDKKLGTSSLNLSMDDTALPSHYLMLQHFLKQGHTVDLVILAITPWDVSNQNPRLGNNTYRFLPYLYEDYVYQHFKALSNTEDNPLLLSYFQPFVGVGYYNAELFYPGLLTLLNSEKRNRFDISGNYVYPDSNFKGEHVKAKAYTFNPQNPYLDKIIKLCKQNNIALRLYQSPIYQSELKISSSNTLLINHIDVLKDEKYFYDRIHVNKKGRELVTKVLIDQLTLTY